MNGRHTYSVNKFCLAIIGLVVLVSILHTNSVFAVDFKVGVAKKDITFLSQGRGMMGYGDFAQKTRGIESSLFARSFYVASPSARVAIVVVDLCMTSSRMKSAVLARLNEKSISKNWSWPQLMILATHTHSTPGGYVQHDIYNVTSQGFDKKNFETIVTGITDAVLKAEASAVPAEIGIAKGELRGASTNRSLEAYLLNVDHSEYEDHTDPTHYVLSFKDLNQRPIGMLDFFAVHTTSMSKKNQLISSDNKGRAARKVENHFGDDFVAAFANANEGDASPNIFRGTSQEKSFNDLQKSDHLAKLQSTHALELWNRTKQIQGRSIEGLHLWVNMFEQACEPAMGESFAAGAEDGPSDLPGFYEGMRQGEFRPLPDLGVPFVRLVQNVVGSSQGNPDCHYPKPILFAGDAQHYRILPRTLPFHLIRIGDILLAGSPAEMTTMAGRRLRKQIFEATKTAGINDVLLAGLANDYSGYVSTPEEYQLQHYEGAHTLYGEKTLSVHLESFQRLSAKLGLGFSEEGQAPEFFEPLKDFLKPASKDGKWLFESRGHVLVQPRRQLDRGDVVRFVVRSSLPSRMGKSNKNMFELEKWGKSRWNPLTMPEDSNIEWRRDSNICYNCSRLEVRMSTMALRPGKYRLVQRGKWQSLFRLESYESFSKPFEIF